MNSSQTSTATTDMDDRLSMDFFSLGPGPTGSCTINSRTPIAAANMDVYLRGIGTWYTGDEDHRPETLEISGSQPRGPSTHEPPSPYVTFPL